MANSLFRSLRRASSVLKVSYPASIYLRSVVRIQTPICSPFKQYIPLEQRTPSWVYRNFNHGSVNLVISGGETKFETHEVDPPKKEKWKTKKRLKQQRKREKEKRKAANNKDPRRLGVKGKKKKQKFANAEERIKYKIEKAKIKEAMLVERLKRYEIPRAQGPMAKPDDLTGEERFYLKKMAQKSTNYLQVGRRGLFGGVILNMHMHWKRHETVKVICKPCKLGQVHEYAQEIARLSGGIPIHIIGDDTIIFYRGRNYVQPEIMSPVDTLSKKKALEKSKYEQSLESVRRFIAIAEKELELYYRHVALYGDPNDRDPLSILERPSGNSWMKRNHGLNEKKIFVSRSDSFSTDTLDTEADSTDIKLWETEDNFGDGHITISESDSEEDGLLDFEGEGRGAYYTKMEDDKVGTSSGSLSMSKHSYHYNNHCL